MNNPNPKNHFPLTPTPSPSPPLHAVSFFLKNHFCIEFCLWTTKKKMVMCNSLIYLFSTILNINLFIHRSSGLYTLSTYTHTHRHIVCDLWPTFRKKTRSKKKEKKMATAWMSTDGTKTMTKTEIIFIWPYTWMLQWNDNLIICLFVFVTLFACLFTFFYNESFYIWPFSKVQLVTIGHQ